MSSSGKIRVALADDHAIVRVGLRAMIQGQGDMEVVAESCNAAEAVSVAGKIRPNIVVLDLSMPEGGGLAAIRKIRTASPLTRVVVLTMHDDPAYLRSVISSGGWGYVLKRSADVDLLAAIRMVYRGRRYVDATMAHHLLEDGNPLFEPRSKLSPQETRILQALAEGYTYQQIASRFFLSVKTVETYRARITQKLGIRKRAELIRIALQLGLLSTETTPPDE